MKANVKSRAAAVISAVFVAMAGILGFTGLENRIDRVDLAVVLGAKVETDGHPSERLQKRLQKVEELYRKGFFPFILVSGGVGKEGFDEAQVMKNVLIDDGIPSKNILVDSSGNTTYLTAMHAAAAMREQNWTRVMIISQFFHLPRARLAFRHFGVSSVYYAHADYFELRDLYSLAREVFGFCYYAVRSYR